MAPTRPPDDANGSDNQKPTALATVAKAKRVLPKYSHSQRSSLRLAIQDSLRESTTADNADADATTHLSSTTTSQSLSSSVETSISPSNADLAPRRRSMRQTLKASLRIDTSTTTTINYPASPSTPSLSLSGSTVGLNSIPSTPTTVATTPRTPATPFSTSSFTTATSTPSPIVTPSKATRKSALQRPKRQHKAKVTGDDSDNDSSLSDPDSDSEYEDKDKRRQFARVDDPDRPNANGIATPFKGWYRIKTIVTESRNQSGGLIYLVDWEGVDPRTGISWPSSWVESKNVSVAAIREWNDFKSRSSNMKA
ncbi:hypothetical protein F4805DRAFT_460292 [Annulohypoxylon moriforme]|nr:hypothetical protein F4805DRAFT_460292 [Annulohypoxylon moriforme]